ncbi:MAG TPA: isoprenyl transferase [Clostridiales bacterium]|nr:isoprenyl transferase [Clostridiales bacterium]
MPWFKKKRPEQLQGPLPRHIAIIMDGNGRWAQKRGLPRSQGHRRGVRTLERIARYCSQRGIQYLTVYAFSTENWNRPPREVEVLMNLMREYIQTVRQKYARDNIRLKIIGDKSRLPRDLKILVDDCEQSTAANTGMLLMIAWNYGGRDELTAAARSLAEDVRSGKMRVEQITAETISDRLYTAGAPDPDLLIRTSGEYRTSNFLIWQSAYAELYFTPLLWPDFKPESLEDALREYARRDRRFGGVET